MTRSYFDTNTGQLKIQRPELEGKPILMCAVDNSMNVFQILANCELALRDFGIEHAERKAILKELTSVSDNDMFHARLRFHFTVMADQVPIINHMAAQARNPYVADCDNCDPDGTCPDYREGAKPGARMQCDACGG
jgi:hypothetical protein